MIIASQEYPSGLQNRQDELQNCKTLPLQVYYRRASEVATRWDRRLFTWLCAVQIWQNGPYRSKQKYYYQHNRTPNASVSLSAIKTVEHKRRNSYEQVEADPGLIIQPA